MYYGIDVSYANSTVNWSQVRSAGKDFAIIRAGYGAGGSDDQAIANFAGAKQNNIKRGVYWFSYAYTAAMAAKEARYCVSFLQSNGINPELPVFFDWEDDSYANAIAHGVVPDAMLVRNMTSAFCGNIASTGLKAGWYSNIDYYQRFYTASFKIQNPSWYFWGASWGSTQPSIGEHLWQYEVGTCPGVTGQCDLDVWYGAYPKKSKNMPIWMYPSSKII